MKEQLIANLRLQKELLLCEQDPIYFMENYVNIRHSVHGNMLFSPHSYQERFLGMLLSMPQLMSHNSHRRHRRFGRDVF